MNETMHDQYMLDASKQTNSLVTASATHISSACLLACLLGLKQPHAISLRPESRYTQTRWLGKSDMKAPYMPFTYIH